MYGARAGRTARVRKLCWHTTLGDISVQEPQYRSASKKVRPFAQSAQVSARGCSRLLQRVLTDFGADMAYARVMDKLVEHYGIVVPESTIRRVTLEHARKIHTRTQGSPQGLPQRVAPTQTFIVETDSTMVPTVKSPDLPGDKRKNKTVQWAEAKISLAHVQGSKEMSYAATLQGDVHSVGKQLRKCARRAGFGKGHRVHGVGYGAPWIAKQVKYSFGQQGSYLVDFFHVCDYLSAAAQAICTQSAEQQAWLSTQKERLKTSRFEPLLNDLQSNIEPTNTPDDEAPIRQCWR